MEKQYFYSSNFMPKEMGCKPLSNKYMDCVYKMPPMMPQPPYIPQSQYDLYKAFNIPMGQMAPYHMQTPVSPESMFLMQEPQIENRKEEEQKKIPPVIPPKPLPLPSAPKPEIKPQPMPVAPKPEIKPIPMPVPVPVQPKPQPKKMEISIKKTQAQFIPQPICPMEQPCMPMPCGPCMLPKPYMPCPPQPFCHYFNNEWNDCDMNQFMEMPMPYGMFPYYEE